MSIWAATCTQLEQSWGTELCSGWGWGAKKQESGCIPSRPPATACQETQSHVEALQVSRTLLLSYHLLHYGACLRNSWILEMSPVQAQPATGMPSSVSTGNDFDYFSRSISFFTDFLSKLLLTARSIYCMLNFVLSYTSVFFLHPLLLS